MLDSRHFEFKRLIAGIIIIMMLVVVLSSSCFIAGHVDHDCAGEDCPVCAFIRQCEKVLLGYGSFTSVKAVTLPYMIILLFLFFTVSPWIMDTPVSKKVRMNN